MTSSFLPLEDASITVVAFPMGNNSNITLKCTDLEGELALHVKSKKIYIYSRTSRCTVHEKMGMKEY